MSKLTLVFMFFGISVLNYTCISHDKSTIKNYDLNIHGLPQNQYALSCDGNSFCYLNSDGWLVRIILESQVRDSVPLLNDANVYLNLVSRMDGFSILSYSKQNQYNEEVVKNILLRNYNNNLKLTDSIVFLTIKKSHVLDEDFNFSTLFIDKIKNIFYFNTEFSDLLVIENNSWSSDFQTGNIVDFANGILYEAKIKVKNGSNEFWIDSNNDDILLNDAEVIPSQFSVLDNKIVYYGNNNIYWQNKLGSSRWNKIGNKNYNPCNRFEKGIYNVNKGILSVIFLH